MQQGVTSSNKLENILIIDTETGGLDARVHSLLEIGFILYNVPHRTILQKSSSLLAAEINPAYHINNIDVQWGSRINSASQRLFLDFLAVNLSVADVVIAHNHEFDKKFLESVEYLKPHSLRAKWSCSRRDIKWPGLKSLKLQEIARYYGVDYTNAHRALDDCEILLQCLLKLEDFEHQVEALQHRRRTSFEIRNMAEATP